MTILEQRCVKAVGAHPGSKGVAWNLLVEGTPCASGTVTLRAKPILGAPIEVHLEVVNGLHFSKRVGLGVLPRFLLLVEWNSTAGITNMNVERGLAYVGGGP